MRSRKRRYHAPVLRRLFTLGSALSLVLCLTSSFGKSSSPSEWTGFLDLAAELPRIAPADVEYRSLPMLDGAAPFREQLRRRCHVD